MEEYDVADFLRFALQHFDIQILRMEGATFDLEQGYAIEIESDQLFKLMYQQQVIAPFNNVEELCNFIKMDMQLHEKN